MSKTFVTKSYLPPKEEFLQYVDEIYESHVLTNQGPLARRLQTSIARFLSIPSCLFINNGTIAIQLALRALGLVNKQIITTPFTYVATSTSILWEYCTPVFVDINADDYTINADLIEQAITSETGAILGVHVFGVPCDVVRIDEIAKKHNLYVIYDGAHAFGVESHGKSVFAYGDISTCSFHATKLFHTFEGGMCTTLNPQLLEKMRSLRSFGHDEDVFFDVGMNGKNSEIHAAMGLANLPHVPEVIEKRQQVCDLYTRLLDGLVQFQVKNNCSKYNYAYYPVAFKNEEELLCVFDDLKGIDVYPRRYFYPSLNTIPYMNSTCSVPVSEDIATRIACLPLHPHLPQEMVHSISQSIRQTLRGRS